MIEERLFPQSEILFLYDLTNTYFEGQCTNNPLAKNGHSKEKRSDCPLVTLALVVDSSGFPKFSQVYRGNQGEPETLKDVLECLEEKYKGVLPIHWPMLAMDRGIATKENLKLIKDKKFQYVIIER